MNLDAIADAIDRVGQLVTLRRPAAHGTHFDVQTMAQITIPKRLTLNELVDGVNALNQSILISNRDIARRQWPGPPRKGDQIIVDGKPTTLLEDPDTTKIGDVVVSHRIWVRG